MKFAGIHPGQTTYSFAAADSIVNTGMANGQNARGHTLVWHNAIPGWVTSGDFSPTQLKAILFSHVDTVVGRYKDRLFCWDVVNEAFQTDGSMRSTFWYDQPGIGYAGQGTKYLEEIFKRARSADPDCELFYNDFGIEAINAKSDAVYAMAQDFKNRGVPLDGIGFQMHIGLPGPSIASWRANLQRLNSLGLKLHITEMDVRLPVDAAGNATAANLTAQATAYFNIIGAAMAFPNFEVVQTWGFSDKYSWIPSFFNGFGAALPLDRRFNRKPAWWAIRDVLFNQAEFLAVAEVSEGSSALLVTNNLFSAGRARELIANGPDAFITLEAEIPYSGPYNVRVGIRRNNSSGRFQLQSQPVDELGFTSIGAVQDTYSPAAAYAELNLGTSTFVNAGPHRFRFLVTGKNTSSSGFNLAIDYLRFIPAWADGNQPPAIAGISDVTTEATGVPFFIPFKVSDREPVESALTIAATSSSTTLLPNANILIAGAGQHRVLSLRPATNQFGTTTVKVVVTDTNGRAATNQFNFVVNPPPPRLAISFANENVTLMWASNSGAFHLESADAFGGAWERVTNAPALNGASWSSTFSLDRSIRFFRLSGD